MDKEQQTTHSVSPWRSSLTPFWNPYRTSVERPNFCRVGQPEPPLAKKVNTGWLDGPKGFGSGSATYLWQEEQSHNSSFEPCTNLYRFSKQNVAPEMESTSVCGPFSLSAQPITPNPVHILLTDPVHIHSLPRPISGMRLHGRRKESLGEWRQRCCCCGSGPVHLGAAPSVGTDLEKFEEK